MPTPEEIKKIAREVASQIEPKKGFGGESYWIRLSTEIIEILANDYCIVPKSKVKEEYEVAILLQHSNKIIDQDCGMIRKSLMDYLFGKSLFEEEK